MSCGKAKQSHPCPAREMYTSPAFRAARKYAERESDGGWFILSAKHKLLPPDEVIETYDKSLSNCSADKRKAWSRDVFESLEGQFIPGEHGFIILAGNDYCRYLRPMLHDRGFQTWRPLEGLKQGEQRARLKQLNERKESGID